MWEGKVFSFFLDDLFLSSFQLHTTTLLVSLSTDKSLHFMHESFLLYDLQIFLKNRLLYSILLQGSFDTLTKGYRGIEMIVRRALMRNLMNNRQPRVEKNG